jgi:hypothetical protein
MEDVFLATTARPSSAVSGRRWKGGAAALLAAASIATIISVRHGGSDGVKTVGTTATSSATAPVATTSPNLTTSTSATSVPPKVERGLAAVLPPTGDRFAAAWVNYEEGIYTGSDVQTLGYASSDGRSVLQITATDRFTATESPTEFFAERLLDSIPVRVNGAEAALHVGNLVPFGFGGLGEGAAIVWRLKDTTFEVVTAGQGDARSRAERVAASVTLSAESGVLSLSAPDGFEQVMARNGLSVFVPFTSTEMAFVENHGARKADFYERFHVTATPLDEWARVTRNSTLGRTTSPSGDATVERRIVGNVQIDVRSSKPNDAELAGFADSLRPVSESELRARVSAASIFVRIAPALTTEATFLGPTGAGQWRLKVTKPYELYAGALGRSVEFDVRGAGGGGTAFREPRPATGIRGAEVYRAANEAADVTIWGLGSPDTVTVVVRNPYSAVEYGRVSVVAAEGTAEVAFAVAIPRSPSPILLDVDEVQVQAYAADGTAIGEPIPVLAGMVR